MQNEEPELNDELDIYNSDTEDDGEEQGGLYEHFRFTVDKGQSLLRIDKYLTSRIENASRNRIQSTADGGNILVNDKAVKSSYKVKPLDIISVVMPYPHRGIEIIPENISLDILFEDDDVLVIDKKAGMVVHPGHGNYSGTLVNALAWYLKDSPSFNNADERGGLLVHRIDKNTSGVIVVAKNELAHSRLSRQFFDHTTLRRYIALVWGTFNDTEGSIIGNIARNRYDKLKMAVYPPDSEIGKHAITHYKVIEELGYVSLVECRLETGRTHQIRVHFESIGHPLFNDERYGGNRILKGTTFSKYRQFVENCFALLPRHALHAALLGFKHPATGRDMLFESSLSGDMTMVIDKWRNYITYRKIEEDDE
ncbi:MAG: RluA family pseudouridine synthase [Prevotellaceae bacterium]|jgi:23S rRNA pseudouridine1911/1915/1917 synthase|nr:RluA family pseudouridine synthase [Prevotellaceae bacterium]